MREKVVQTLFIDGLLCAICTTLFTIIKSTMPGGPAAAKNVLPGAGSANGGATRQIIPANPAGFPNTPGVEQSRGLSQSRSFYFF